MAEQDFTTNTVKRWPLWEQVPPGPIQDNLVELKDLLEKILKVKDSLLTLYHYAEDTEQGTITLANETVFTFACMIDTNVDSVFHYLNEIFKPKFQDPARAQEAQTPFQEIPLVQALNGLVELYNLAPDQMVNVKNYAESLMPAAQGGAA